jgi:hypothetical protein
MRRDKMNPNIIIKPATQALEETEDRVKFILLGEQKESAIKPIIDCCNKCNFWKKHFPTIEDCRTFQKEESEMRGFKDVICAEQIHN